MGTQEEREIARAAAIAKKYPGTEKDRLYKLNLDFGDQVVKVKKYGMDFEMRGVHLKDPYARMLITLKGLSPIAGPLAANVDMVLTQLTSRVNNKTMAPEVLERFKEDMRSSQKAVYLSDENGDKTDEVIEEALVDKVQMFGRTDAGALGLDSRAIRAAIRECLSLAAKDDGKADAVSAWREQYKHQSGIAPLFVEFTRNGKPITEPDEIWKHPVHAWVGKQQIHTIWLGERIHAPWEISFVFEMALVGSLTLEYVIESLRFLPRTALGAQRPFGCGICQLDSVSQVVYSGKPTYCNTAELLTGGISSLGKAPEAPAPEAPEAPVRA